MALAANDTAQSVRGANLYREDGITDEFYAGGYAMIGSPNHGTAATVGTIAPFNDEAEAIPLGFIQNRVTGLASAAEVPEVHVDIEGGIRYVTVTGLAGTDADNSVPVYATDDGTFTMTRPTTGIALGYVANWATSSKAWVHFYSKETLDAIALGGCGQERHYLGHVDVASLTTADVRTSIPMANHGKILTVDAYVDVAFTGSAGSSVALQLEFGTTNITGGVITLTQTAGATKGAKIAGTSVTALNVYNEGSLLSIKATLTGAALTAGTVDLFIECQRLIGT